MSTPHPPINSNGCPSHELLTLFALEREAASPAEGERVLTHLSQCAACREEVDLMKRLHSEMGQMEAAPSSALRGRILSSISFKEARPAPRFSTLSLLRWGSLGAAVATLAVAVIQPLASSFTPQFEAAQSRATGAPSANIRVPADRLEKSTAAGGAAPQPAAPAESPGLVSEAQPSYSANPAGGPQRVNGDPYVAGAAKGYSYAGEDKLPRVGMADDSLESRNRSANAPLQGQVTPDDVNLYTRGKEIDEVRRKVVQNADLTLKVRRRLESVQTEIAERLKKEEGYVEATQLSGVQDAERVARMTLRVPVAKFEPFVEYLSEVGEVLEKGQKAEDVTGRWVDQRAVVREMRKEEERLVKAMERAKSAAEVRRLRWELLALRPRIASAEERFALTSKLAALATIRVTLREPPEARVQGNLWQDTEGTARNAFAAFLVALRVPITILVWLAVFSPLWLPCLLVYRWATRKLRQDQQLRPQLAGAAD